MKKIQRTWPELWELNLSEITEQACKDWAARLNQNFTGHYYNNTIGTLRMVLRAGIKAYKEQCGRSLENPASEIQRARITQRQLQLPEPGEFRRLVGRLRKEKDNGRAIGDLVEFLAYSGLRVKSEAIWVEWEDIDWERKELIVRGHPQTGTKNGEMRRVPLIMDMEKLLRRLKGKARQPSGRILKLGECNKVLGKACDKMGIPALKHHDLRHLFATRCIESGVDIPTVARWLGHKDGGVLAMRTYGHLRNEHSQAMAQKVKF